MISKTFLRWFLTILVLLAFYIGLALFDLSFNLELTYNFTVLSAEDSINIWQAFVMSLVSAHNVVMNYVYLATPIMIALLFVIHKKVR